MRCGQRGTARVAAVTVHIVAACIVLDGCAGYRAQPLLSQAALAPSVAALNRTRPGAAPATDGFDESKIAALQHRVYRLVRHYRVRGHIIAAVDPLGLPRPVPHELELDFFGFAEGDMDRPVHCETLQSNRRAKTVSQPRMLRKTGFRTEFMDCAHTGNDEGGRNRP